MSEMRVTYDDGVDVGWRLTLACSCEAEVVVPLIMIVRRHCVVRILAPRDRCQKLHHAPGDSAVVRWQWEGGRRVFADVHAS